MLYVDDSDESEAYRAAGTRNTKRKPDGKADFEGIGSMWSQATNDALKERGKKDLDAITGSLFKPGMCQCVYAIAATHRHANRRHLYATHAERLDDDSIHGEDDGPGRLVRLRGRHRLRQCPSMNPHRHAVAAVASRRWRGASRVLPRRSSSSTTTSPRARTPGSTTFS
ncbi:unnamed protein product, partial [Pelagomonas calceolata]